MGDIQVGSQIFDLVFHPTHSTVYTGLLTGEIKAFSFESLTQKDPQTTKLEPDFCLKPSKRSCRGLTINEDGSKLWAGGKGRILHTIDTTTGKVVETRAEAHKAPINRIRHLMPWLLSSGDDDGVIKMWDPRQNDSIRTYSQHFDYITDFLWLGDKKHLVATSGDGTLSVMDVRSNKTEPFAQSEDQEDELLSLVSIRGGAKIVVGTQIGILSIFNRSAGWGDCVDRIPGHPHSVDALCSLPASYPEASTTILTGSSDGFVRAVQPLPTKLLGVVADHGEFPVERIAIGQSGSRSAGEDQGDGMGRWWAGSVGHEDLLKLTDLDAFFHGEKEDEDDDEEKEKEEPADEDGSGNQEVEDDSSDSDSKHGSDSESGELAEEREGAEEDGDDDSGADSDSPKPKKRKRKNERDPLMVKKKKGKNEVEVEGAFFDSL